MLHFIEKRKQLLKSYFLLDNRMDVSDRDRIVSLYKLPKYRSSKREARVRLIHNTFQKMEQLFPPMMVSCVGDALLLIFTDVSQKRILDNGIVSGESPFLRDNYINVILTKVILMEYALENSDDDKENVIMKLGLIGEDV